MTRVTWVTQKIDHPPSSEIFYETPSPHNEKIWIWNWHFFECQKRGKTWDQEKSHGHNLHNFLNATTFEESKSSKKHAYFWPFFDPIFLWNPQSTQRENLNLKLALFRMSKKGKNLGSQKCATHFFTAPRTFLIPRSYFSVKFLWNPQSTQRENLNLKMSLLWMSKKGQKPGIRKVRCALFNCVTHFLIAWRTFWIINGTWSSFTFKFLWNP